MFGTLHLGNLSAANIASVRRSLSTFPESFLSQIMPSPKLGVMSRERCQTQPSTNATMRSVGKPPAAASPRPTRTMSNSLDGGRKENEGGFPLETAVLPRAVGKLGGGQPTRPAVRNLYTYFGHALRSSAAERELNTLKFSEIRERTRKNRQAAVRSQGRKSSATTFMAF